MVISGDSLWMLSYSIRKAIHRNLEAHPERKLENLNFDERDVVNVEHRAIIAKEIEKFFAGPLAPTPQAVVRKS